jgi:hypothetical protein
LIRIRIFSCAPIAKADERLPGRGKIEHFINFD